MQPNEHVKRNQFNIYVLQKTGKKAVQAKPQAIVLVSIRGVYAEERGAVGQFRNPKSEIRIPFTPCI